MNTVFLRINDFFYSIQLMDTNEGGDMTEHGLICILYIPKQN